MSSDLDDIFASLVLDPPATNRPWNVDMTDELRRYVIRQMCAAFDACDIEEIDDVKTDEQLMIDLCESKIMKMETPQIHGVIGGGIVAGVYPLWAYCDMRDKFPQLEPYANFGHLVTKRERRDMIFDLVQTLTSDCSLFKGLSHDHPCMKWFLDIVKSMEQDVLETAEDRDDYNNLRNDTLQSIVRKMVLIKIFDRTRILTLQRKVPSLAELSAARVLSFLPLPIAYVADPEWEFDAECIIKVASDFIRFCPSGLTPK